MVDSKVAVHKHDKILDDQIDEFKEKIDVQFKWDIVKYSGKDLQL